MEKCCPKAWFVDFANPVAVYSGMLNNHTQIRALGICGGGSFLLAQLALALVFKSPVSPMQWGGVVAIVVGMILLAGGKP